MRLTSDVLLWSIFCTSCGLRHWPHDLMAVLSAQLNPARHSVQPRLLIVFSPLLQSQSSSFGTSVPDGLMRKYKVSFPKHFAAVIGLTLVPALLLNGRSTRNRAMLQFPTSILTTTAFPVLVSYNPMSFSTLRQISIMQTRVLTSSFSRSSFGTVLQSAMGGFDP